MMMKRPEEGMIRDMRFRGPEEIAGINPPMPGVPRRPSSSAAAAYRPIPGASTG